MPGLSISEIVGDFPTFRVAFGVLEGLQPRSTHPERVDAFVAEAEERAAALLAATDLAALPEVLHWRAAYRSFGSKKTSYRDACEALLRRIQVGEGLPRVLPLVDLYNAISVKYRMPVGVDDLALVRQPNAFRYSRPGDTFLDGGRTPPEDAPPAPGEVVYADQEKCLCRRWNWRQDARSRVRLETRDALVVVQTLEEDGEDRLARATDDFTAVAREALGASVRWEVASAASPSVII